MFNFSNSYFILITLIFKNLSSHSSFLLLRIRVKDVHQWQLVDKVDGCRQNYSDSNHPDIEFNGILVVFDVINEKKVRD